MIYLDHAATTPVSPAVQEAMLPWITEKYGNASAMYSFASQSREAVSRARRRTAALLHASPAEICFTSGGTESDNQAIIGAALAGRHKGKHVITSQIEHHAVLRSCEFLESIGFEITYLAPDAQGRIRPEDVEAAIRDETILISIMTANNETGTIEPIARIGEVARAHQILFHTDAVQAFGHMPMNMQELPVDMLSASAHKLGGPKGTGLLYIRRGVSIPSYIHGGEQERGKRAGTENTAGIVGFGAAADEAAKQMTGREERVRRLRDMLEQRLLREVSGVTLQGDPDNRLAGILSVSIEGVQAQMMLILLDEAGICASAGSACASGSPEPSHVLKAMRVPERLLRSTLRFSLGPENTEEEIEETVRAVLAAVLQLRKA